MFTWFCCWFFFGERPPVHQHKFNCFSLLKGGVCTLLVGFSKLQGLEIYIVWGRLSVQEIRHLQPTYLLYQEFLRVCFKQFWVRAKATIRRMFSLCRDRFVRKNWQPPGGSKVQETPIICWIKRKTTMWRKNNLQNQDHFCSCPKPRATLAPWPVAGPPRGETPEMRMRSSLLHGVIWRNPLKDVCYVPAACWTCF